jgi:hypothetical protein
MHALLYYKKHKIEPKRIAILQSTTDEGLVQAALRALTYEHGDESGEGRCLKAYYSGYEVIDGDIVVDIIMESLNYGYGFGAKAIILKMDTFTQRGLK